MKFSLAPLLAFTVYLLAPAPGLAFNFDDLLQNYLGARPDSSPTMNKTEQLICKTNINTRQTQLQAQLESGVSAGQIDRNEETVLREDLNRIAVLESQYLSDSNFTRAEVQSLLQELNSFSLKIQTFLTNSTKSQPGIEPPTNTNAPFQFRSRYQRHLEDLKTGDLASSNAFKADVDRRQAQLESAIASSAASGRISGADFHALKLDLMAIEDYEKLALRYGSGKISYPAGSKLVVQLDALNTKLAQKLSFSAPAGTGKPGSDWYWRHLAGLKTGDQAKSNLFKADADTMIAQLDASITEAGYSGRLNWTESEALRTELDGIIAYEKKALLLMQGKIGYAAGFKLVGKLDTINANLTQALASSSPSGQPREWYWRHLHDLKSGDLAKSNAFKADIDTRQAQLDAAITDGVSSGRLSWSDSSSLRTELEALENYEKKALIIANQRISYAAGTKIIAQLDAINAELTQRLRPEGSIRGRHHGRGRGDGYRRDDWDAKSSFSPATPKESLLRQRIEFGMSGGKLSKSEGFRLLADEAKISELTDSLRSNSGSISFNEQQKMFVQIDELSKNIAKELAARQVP